MNFDEQRKLALKLASKYEAPETLALVKDANSCYSDIFKTAVAEIGMDSVVSEVLQGPASWAHMAYLNIPDIGTSHSDALSQKAAQASKGEFIPEQLNAAAPFEMPPANARGLNAQQGYAISAMNLDCQAILVCNWTLNWTEGGVDEPKNSVSD
jgi:hypothetical protein